MSGIKHCTNHGVKTCRCMNDAMVASMLKYQEERKIKPGRETCTKCGTNLTGNEVDKCMEQKVSLMCQYCLADLNLNK